MVESLKPMFIIYFFYKVGPWIDIVSASMAEKEIHPLPSDLKL